jgi:hypothetical protein
MSEMAAVFSLKPTNFPIFGCFYVPTVLQIVTSPSHFPSIVLSESISMIFDPQY